MLYILTAVVSVDPAFNIQVSVRRWHGGCIVLMSVLYPLPTVCCIVISVLFVDHLRNDAEAIAFSGLVKTNQLDILSRRKWVTEPRSSDMPDASMKWKWRFYYLWFFCFVFVFLNIVWNRKSQLWYVQRTIEKKKKKKKNPLNRDERVHVVIRKLVRLQISIWMILVTFLVVECFLWHAAALFISHNLFVFNDSFAVTRTQLFEWN